MSRSLIRDAVHLVAAADGLLEQLDGLVHLARSQCARAIHICAAARSRARGVLDQARVDILEQGLERRGAAQPLRWGSDWNGRIMW